MARQASPVGAYMKSLPPGGAEDGGASRSGRLQRAKSRAQIAKTKRPKPPTMLLISPRRQRPSSQMFLNLKLRRMDQAALARHAVRLARTVRAEDVADIATRAEITSSRQLPIYCAKARKSWCRSPKSQSPRRARASLPTLPYRDVF